MPEVNVIHTIFGDIDQIWAKYGDFGYKQCD
jgi:hypothetical protein